MLKHSRGMATTGSAQDIADWQAMVRDAMRQSESLCKLIIAIGNDPDANHAIKLDLGRSQPYVFIDDIATNAIDLDDLEHFSGQAKCRAS